MKINEKTKKLSKKLMNELNDLYMHEGRNLQMNKPKTAWMNEKMNV